TFKIMLASRAAIMQDLDEHIAKIREEVAGRVKTKARTDYETILGQLQTEHGLAADNEKTLRDQVESLAKEAEKVGKISIELEQLRGDIQLEEKVAKDIGEQAEKLRVEVRAPARAALAQEAGLQKKELKKFLLALIVGPLAVIGAVCLGVAWLEFRIRRIR